MGRVETSSAHRWSAGALAEYEIPDSCLYTREDEWVRKDGDRVVVGITDYAQQQLGDVVFVELPDTGDEIQQGESFGVIESVKAVSDLFAPVTGRVADTNSELEDNPELVNESCYRAGWIMAVTGVTEAELAELMDAAAYRQYVSDREE